jgi:hypothetical protein
MTGSELESLKKWADFWSKVEQLAFLGVVITLAIEFAASFIEKPLQKRLDDAKDLLLAQTYKDAASANKSAEDERMARIKLAQNLQDRSFDDGDLRTKLLPFISHFQGPPPIPACDIFLWDDSGESSRLATRLYVALARKPNKLAGWGRVRAWRVDSDIAVNADNPDRGVPTGIWVRPRISSDPWVQDAAKAITDSLRNSGLQVGEGVGYPIGGTNADFQYGVFVRWKLTPFRKTTDEDWEKAFDTSRIIINIGEKLPPQIPKEDTK